jgi:putative oxidoreductase
MQGGIIMATSSGDPRPIIPALAPLYSQASDLSYLIVRVTAGGMLLVHGLNKVLYVSITGFAANSLARRGIEPSLPLAYWIFFMETIGAICIILGLFTRFFAVALIVQFLVIIFVAHWGAGFGWNRPGGGWEYPLFWGLIWVAIALRGGGPYSLDRKLGREL